MSRLSEGFLWSRTISGAHGVFTSSVQPRLHDFVDFGSNPGDLAAKTYVPAGLAAASPLVVVLHGCTQHPEGYDRGSGFSQIADEQGFALLYPEQVRANNPNLCFNWFIPADTRRGSGEVASIIGMVETMIERHDLDSSRVFVTGLSAGGAMTAALLAAYPDTFAGGAIVAGLPSGVAANVTQALAQMRKAGPCPPAITTASNHKGPWPTVAVWHGDADRTVDQSNAEAIVDQWRAVHAVGKTPARSERGEGFQRRVWTDAKGRDVIEHYSIDGMGHGTPLATHGTDGCGVEGAHMIDVGVSSTRLIVRSWGLHTSPARSRSSAVEADKVRPARVKVEDRLAADSFPALAGAFSETQPQRVIEKALRAAGLMR